MITVPVPEGKWSERRERLATGRLYPIRPRSTSVEGLDSQQSDGEKIESLDATAYGLFMRKITPAS